MRKCICRNCSIFLILIMVISLFAGCGQNSDTKGQSTQQTQNSQQASKAQDSQAEETGSLIAKTPITLKYFIGLGDKASQVVKSKEEVAGYQKIEEKTGIKIEWIHPTPNKDIEQLNLMIASQTLPDLIFVYWDQFPGGISKALKDNIIIKLNDEIDKSAPNLLKVLENKDVSKQTRLDDGTVCLFPVVRDDPSVRVWFGPQIRKDWLDRVGMQPPKTIDDWYNVLKAFKEQDANGNGDPADEIPFVSGKVDGLLNFTGAWGLVRLDFFKDGDKIKFSPIEDSFKNYLITMKKWYSEGLIDPDFAVTDGNGFASKVTDNKAGAYFGSLAGNLGRFSGILQQKEPTASLIGLPWTSGPAGKSYQTESQHIKAVIGTETAITTKNKYVTESVKWLDYHYGEEGHMYMNFGVEGESYEIVNGYPTFTDNIFKNPQGLPYDIAYAKYCPGANMNEAMRQDPREFEQYSLRTDYQKEANKLWGSGNTDLLIPPVSSTVDESSELAKIMNDVNTYVNEMVVKFIMNQEPIDNFDIYVQNIKKMKIDRAVEIKQQAYDRYMKR